MNSKILDEDSGRVFSCDWVRVVCAVASFQKSRAWRVKVRARCVLPAACSKKARLKQPRRVPLEYVA